MTHTPSRKRFALAALALPVLLAAGAASAKTLVFCSEGSPENFYPGVNTTGTSFDGNEPSLQPPGRVRARRHQGRAGPGRDAGTVSADGTEYTFHLRKGVKWHTTSKSFKPTRDMNADDVLFMFERQWKEDNPYFKVTSPNHSYFNDMGMPKLLKSVDQGRRLHRQDHAQQARGAIPGQPGHAVCGRAVEGIRRSPCSRPARPRRSTRTRSAPARSTWCSTRRTPSIRYKAFPAVLGRQGQDRRPGLRDHARRLGALGQAAEGRVPCHALPEPGRPRRHPQGRRTCRCSSSPA